MDAVGGDHTTTVAALAEAEAYAGAARAVAKLALTSAQGRPDRLEALDAALNAVLKAPGGSTDAVAAAAELVALRRGQGEGLSTNMLRLIAESLRVADVDPSVATELRRAAAVPSGRPVPLSTAMSGISLLTRALSARQGRPLELLVSVGDAAVPESQLELWRQAAIALVKDALARTSTETARLEIRVESFATAIEMSATIPGLAPNSAHQGAAEALIAALDGEASSVSGTSEDFGELDVLAAALGGSIALRASQDGQVRLCLLARRAPVVRADIARTPPPPRAPRMAAALRAA